MTKYPNKDYPFDPQLFLDTVAREIKYSKKIRKDIDPVLRAALTMLEVRPEFQNPYPEKLFENAAILFDALQTSTEAQRVKKDMDNTETEEVKYGRSIIQDTIPVQQSLNQYNNLRTDNDKLREALKNLESVVFDGTDTQVIKFIDEARAVLASTKKETK